MSGRVRCIKTFAGSRYKVVAGKVYSVTACNDEFYAVQLDNATVTFPAECFEPYEYPKITITHPKASQSTVDGDKGLSVGFTADLSRPNSEYQGFMESAFLHDHMVQKESPEALARLAEQAAPPGSSYENPYTPVKVDTTPLPQKQKAEITLPPEQVAEFTKMFYACYYGIYHRRPAQDEIDEALIAYQEACERHSKRTDLYAPVVPLSEIIAETVELKKRVDYLYKRLDYFL